MAPPIIPRVTSSIYQQCLFRHPIRRQFSSTTRAAAGKMDLYRSSQRSPSRPSPKALMSQMESKSGSLSDMIPTELGLMPGTFIRTKSSDLPSIFTKERRKYEWVWFKTRFLDVVGRGYYKFRIRKGKPRPKLARGEIIPIAKDYHEQIFKAFAASDIPKLTELCCDGILANFRMRLSHRSPSTQVSWSLSSYTSRPRILSNRAAPLPVPGVSKCGLRQVVVKIPSKQVLVTRTDAQAREVLREKLENMKMNGEPLTKELKELDDAVSKSTFGVGATLLDMKKVNKATLTEDGQLEGGKKTEKTVTEYLVLQKRMIKGEEEPWMVWGFAQETTLEKMLKMQEEEKQLEAFQAAEARANM